MEKFGATAGYIDALQMANDGFVYVYSVEFAVKVIGLGPWQYLDDGWNKFDFIVLIGSYLEELLTSIGVRPTTFRVLRILRIVRLVRVAKGLKQLLQTLLLSLPSILFAAGMTWDVLSARWLRRLPPESGGRITPKLFCQPRLTTPGLCCSLREAKNATTS